MGVQISHGSLEQTHPKSSIPRERKAIISFYMIDKQKKKNPNNSDNNIDIKIQASKEGLCVIIHFLF